MIGLEEFLDAFFEMVKDLIESISLPTGKGALPATGYCLLITICSAISRLLLNKSAFRWEGGLVATLLFAALALSEKGSLDEVSRLYRAAQSRVKAPKAGPARPNPDVEAPRGANPGDADYIPHTGSDSQDAP